MCLIVAGCLQAPPDMDGDGITNSEDPDIDGDGWNNLMEDFSFPIRCITISPILAIKIYPK